MLISRVSSIALSQMSFREEIYASFRWYTAFSRIIPIRHYFSPGLQVSRRGRQPLAGEEAAIYNYIGNGIFSTRADDMAINDSFQNIAPIASHNRPALIYAAFTLFSPA